MSELFVVPGRVLAAPAETSAALMRALAQLAARATTVGGMVQGLCAIAVWAVEVDGVEISLADGDDLRRVATGRRPVAAVGPLPQGPPPSLRRECVGRRAVATAGEVGGRSEVQFVALSRPGMRGPVQVLGEGLVADRRVLGVMHLCRSRDRRVTRGWAVPDLVAARLVADVAASYLALAVRRWAAT